MIIFELELALVINELKKAHAYLDCEAIIIRHLKKLIDNGNKIPEIETYLKRMLPHLTTLHKAVSREEGINYKYAAEYVNTLITTSYWHSWINSIK